MRPLSDLPPPALTGLKGVLTDIDDTLTSDGRLTASAYAALESMHRAGLLVVPITGRPAGWCDHIARMWPVDAVVGENGALWFRYDPAARRLIKRYAADEAARATRRTRLAEIGARILAAVPGTALASDQLYRESDLAVDWCEDVPRLGPDAVDRIVALMEAEGMTAKVSSIHVNGWFGSYDKLSACRRALREFFAVDLDAERHRFAYLGDSPNDAPMFAFFPLAIGVANVRAFLGRIPSPPDYVTSGRSGEGFAEFARLAVGARGSAADDGG